MRNTILFKSINHYYRNYFNFTQITSRKYYLWSIISNYLFTIGLSNITSLINKPIIIYLWLLFNIIPLFSLITRRLRDVGLTNLSIILLLGIICISSTITTLTQNHTAAFILEISVIIINLLPLLASNELNTKSSNKLLSLLLQQ